MTPTVCYYGGKFRSATKYPPPLEGLPIVEPFAGFAGYSHRWDDGRRDVVLIDADANVATTWEWLLAATPAEILDLPLLNGRNVPSGLPRGAETLIGWFCGFALASPRRRANWHSDSGRFRSTYWCEYSRARVAENRRKMGDRWHFIRGDYTQAPDVVATWFVDPPYANRAGAKYRTRFDGHADLGAWCRERRGFVIACDNVGAEWLPFEPLCGAIGAAGVGAKMRSVEAVWTSEPWRLL